MRRIAPKTPMRRRRSPHFAGAQLAIHLLLDDPYQVPDGYPVKANASFGLYYTPRSVLYDDTLAEIWFVTEEAAQANGFVRAGCPATMRAAQRREAGVHPAAERRGGEPGNHA